ncbi:MAG: hypothetical protein K2R98_20225 [Gemmataceae bacterium]|nr:hypothetical protein [Gemmataceae bacterium]
MNATLTRRTFLRQGAAAAAILGLPFLASGAENEKSPPPWAELLEQANERIKREIKPGIVIIVPASKDDARNLENDLARFIGGHRPECGLFPTKELHGESPLVGSADARHQALLCQAVFVCLPAAEARKAYSEVKADTAVLLLGLDGKPAAALAAQPDLFGKGFRDKLTDLLHGKKGERLEATMEAQRQALGKDRCDRLDTALQGLNSNEFAVRQTAVQHLEELAPHATASLAAVYRTRPPLEVTRRLDQIFGMLFAAASGDKSSLRLPYGTHWVKQTAHCGGGFGDQAERCGLSATPPPTRLFLRILTEKPK